MNLEERVKELENIIGLLFKSDRYVYQKHIQLLDGRNLQLGLTTGTKIGTSASQKLGFFNTTPVTQPSSTGTGTGFIGGFGIAVTEGSTFTAGVGSTAYRISDIVKHLKNLGLITQ